MEGDQRRLENKRGDIITDCVCRGKVYDFDFQSQASYDHDLYDINKTQVQRPVSSKDSVETDSV